MKVRDLIKWLKQDGWEQVRMKGSHRQFRHPHKPGTVTAAGKVGTEIPPGTLNSVLKQASIKVMSRQLKYMIVVEEGPDSFGAHVPDLPGCVAVGDSRSEVLRLIREAIELHIEDIQQQGLEIPKPSSTGEIVEVVAV